jgi:hypothetical protein
MRKVRWVAIATAVAMAAAWLAAASSGAGAAGEAPKATEVGVTATEIHIAAVDDVDNTIRPGLFQDVRNGVVGFANYINSKAGGKGLAGRKVVVDFIDSHLNPTETRNAVIKACSQDFAMIGTAAIFLNNVSDMTGCVDAAGQATGIPDVPFVATSLQQGCSNETFSINPQSVICTTQNNHPQTYQASVGRAFYYQSKFGSDLHGVYVLSGDSQSAYNSQLTSGQGGMRQVGVKSDGDFKVPGSPQQSNFTPIIQAMKSNNSNYAQVGNPYDQTILLRQEAAAQGFAGKVWDCASPCYDANFLPKGGQVVEGEYVSIGFEPFFSAAEQKAVPMVKNYVKYTGADKASGFGVIGFAAGILLRDAINDMVKSGGVNNVTRKNFFDYLNTKANAFNADGLIGTTNVSGRGVTPCFALLQVKNGQFVRVTPTKVGTMNCDKRNLKVYTLDVT